MHRFLSLPAWQMLPGVAAGLCACTVAASSSASSAARTPPQVPARPATMIDAMAQPAVSYLSEWLGGRVDRFEIEPDAATFPATALPSGSLDVRVRPLPAGARPAARMPLWLDLFVDGRPERAMLVTLQVRAYRQCWTAREDLAAGTRLSPGLLERKEIDVAAQASVPWDGEPTGSILRTRVLRGDVLSARQVGPALAVSRGERVLLGIRVGAVEILAPAQALQDADVGQRIPVRADASHGAVLATVRAPGRLEIAP